MGLINSLQTFTSGASGIVDTSAQARFKRAMDTVLVDLGRDITVHLPEGRAQCSDQHCKFDAFYKRYVSTNGQICQTCKGQGYYIEPRYTIYRANIRWTDEPFNSANNIQENEAIGRFGVNFCRTKTLDTSFDDIRNSIGATIDGINVELFEAPRKTAFGNVFYTISWWRVSNR